MPRDYKVYLADILDAIAKIRRYTEGISSTAIASDSKTLDAVVRNLEVVGEAVKMLPEEIRARHQDIEWKKIAGLRDILIHQYFGIDAEIILDVVSNKLPILEKRAKELLEIEGQ